MRYDKQYGNGFVKCDTPVWFDEDVICINKAICWRSDMGVFGAERAEPLGPLVKLLGLDVDGIAVTFYNIRKTQGMI